MTQFFQVLSFLLNNSLDGRSVTYAYNLLSCERHQIKARFSTGRRCRAGRDPAAACAAAHVSVWWPGKLTTGNIVKCTHEINLPTLVLLRKLPAQGGAGAGGLTPEAQQEQEEARQQNEERRATMLVQVLQPQARERRETPSALDSGPTVQCQAQLVTN